MRAKRSKPERDISLRHFAFFGAPSNLYQSLSLLAERDLPLCSSGKTFLVQLSQCPKKTIYYLFLKFDK